MVAGGEGMLVLHDPPVVRKGGPPVAREEEEGLTLSLYHPFHWCLSLNRLMQAFSSEPGPSDKLSVAAEHGVRRGTW